MKENVRKISARNQLKGKIEKVTIGSVNAEVVIRTAAGEIIVSMVTKDSVEDLGLFEGKEVYAVIKASNVMVAVD